MLYSRPDRPSGLPEHPVVTAHPHAAGNGLVRELWLLALLPAALGILLLGVLMTLLHLYQVQRLTAGPAPAFASIDTTHAGQVAAAGTTGDTGLSLINPLPAGGTPPHAMAEPADAAWRNSLIAACALLALCLGLAALLARRIALRTARPFLKFADAVAPPYGHPRPGPVPVSGCHELQRLQRGFNAATRALQEANDGMRAQILEATAELERKNTALEAVNQSRARFLAAASHDLRQPLSALTLFSSTLKLGETDPTRLSRITHIQECVDALEQLFTSLLDLSRLEAGAMQPAHSDFALDAVFNQVSHNFRIGAEQRGLRLVVRKTDAWVRCDRLMLARILNNLVCNAIRYTQSGGVLVAARERAGRIRIDVWDTGSGIAPEHQEQVFEEFFRGPDATQAPGERRGLGLGLATVRRLCDLLSIPVRLASRPGKGTLFSLEIPLASSTRKQAVAPPPESPLDVSGLRVLVVEDEPTILEGLQIMLESWGCEVAVAACGDEAMRAAAAWSRPPDVMISDLQLAGGESGLDVIAGLQRHYACRGYTGFPGLLITGETKAERLREISAARIPVLYKPVTPNQLREAMVATIAIRKLAA